MKNLVNATYKHLWQKNFGTLAKPAHAPAHLHTFLIQGTSRAIVVYGRKVLSQHDDVKYTESMVRGYHE